MKKISVLIVDDSAVVRRILKEILSSDKGIDVVGTAMDPYIARDKIKKLHPDVLTLDVEMPKMDGISFLRNVMRLRPMPVVMISSLTQQGADIALEALSIGAVDYISKPKIDVAHELSSYAEEIIEKVKNAAGARVMPDTSESPVTSLAQSKKIESLNRLRETKPRTKLKTTEKIIAIGASTGGTEAIKEVLINMRPDSPAIVIAQHIPKAFSEAFSKRMDSISPMAVCEARDGQHVLPGHAYIAPGDRHLLLVREGARYYIKLDDGEPCNRHKPSVDVMFRSVEEAAGDNALGVLLTGMGADGARGLKQMHDAGSKTIAQDENSSVVWGMPGEAVKLEATDYVLPLNKIAQKIELL
ncbi:MAG: chemotaxis response regulator protein-glutamate methylesterase, partial [Gammaproteobacteria bacterium]|nr:chemotaxis response regulator protein-glutamate methylesterase [Gammaproteobacteria bacterium]